MKLLGRSLGIVVTLFLLAALMAVPAAQAQDQATFANTANSAMRSMAAGLRAALAASSETTAKANVRTAIAAGEQAVTALRSLEAIATDDVVRSRSKAAFDQTSSALRKARAALAVSGDAFRSLIEAAAAEVEEAIVEFAPVLKLVPTELPRAGALALRSGGYATLVLLGIVFALTGLKLRARQPRLA